MTCPLTNTHITQDKYISLTLKINLRLRNIPILIEFKPELHSKSQILT